MERHPEDGSHRRLDDLRIEQVDRIFRSKDPIGSEPFRHTDDRTQIARIPDGIQGQEQTFFRIRGGRMKVFRFPDDSQDRRRGVELGDPGHGFIADFIPVPDLLDPQAAAARFFHHFLTFHDEKTPLIPVFLGGEGADVLDLLAGDFSHGKNIGLLCKNNYFCGKMCKSERFLVLAILLIGCLAASCSTTRVLGDGQYRLVKNTVKILEDKDFNPNQLEPYIKQRPNRGLAIAGYNWSRNENSLWRKLGKAPVIYDHDLVESSTENMIRHLEYLGYYGSKVDAQAQVHGQKVEVLYEVRLGQRYKITDLHYVLPERGTLAEDFLKDTVNVTIKPGDWLSEAALEAETVRSSAWLRNQGYYGFNKNFYFFEADTLQEHGKASLEMRIAEHTRNESEDLSRELKKFRFGEVGISYPKTLKIKESILKNLNTVVPGDPYSEDVVSNTYSRLSSLNVLSGVNIGLTQAGDDRVDCEINLTPARLQGIKLDLEASSNSIGLFGISPQISFFHRNIFHGGETLNLSFMGNFQFKPNSDARSTEFGVSAGINIPRFLFLPDRWFKRNVPRTEFNASFNYQNRPEYQRNIISFNYGYTGSHKNLYYQLHPVQLSVVRIFKMDDDFAETLINNPVMWNTYVDHFTLGLGTTLYYTTDASVNPQGSYHYARLQFNTAGNVLSLLNPVLPTMEGNDNIHSIWDIPYSQYIRAELSVGKTWRFGRNDGQGVATRLLAGAGYGYGNSLTLPFEQRFYSGGASSLRGWQARSVGPGAAQADDFFIIPNQTGDMKLEANVEYRFKAFWKLHGALFIDAGNVWEMDPMTDEASRFSFKNLGKSIAADWGLGVRVDLNFILVRVDVGFVTRDPSRPNPWVGPDGWFHRGGNAIHFGVGYPF